jgi:hypothetical protein
VSDATNPDDRIVRLAAAALTYAMRDDWPAASKATQAISDEFGGEGLTGAICAWCDWLVAQHPSTAGIEAGGVAVLAWSSDEAPGVETADEVHPETRWAGQVVMARARMDQDTLGALLVAIPREPGATSKYIGALLQSVALTLKRIADGSVARALADLREGDR